MSQNQYELAKQLGYSSYQAYLKSDLWQQIRVFVFNNIGRECIYCFDKATQIHHWRYNINCMRGKQEALLRDLVPICAKCHKAVHFNGQTKKYRHMGAATNRLRKRIARKQSRVNGTKSGV